MSIDASPPPTPPMLSPDRKWFWDGQQWQPIASASEAVHRGIFPSWNGISVESTPTAPQAAQPGAVQTPAPSPGIQYPAQVAANPLDYSAGGAVTPLWRRERKSKVSYPMYVGGALIFLVVGLVLLNALAPMITWPWSAPASVSGPTTPKPTPLAITTRSDFARADAFFNLALTPAMTSFNQATANQLGICSGPLTISCQNALTATDGQIKNVISVIDRGPVPTCIAAPVAKLRLDLTAMDGGIQTALQAYNDNRKTELTQGLSRFGSVGRLLPADLRAIDSTRKVACDTQLVGP